MRTTISYDLVLFVWNPDLLDPFPSKPRALEHLKLSAASQTLNVWKAGPFMGGNPVVLVVEDEALIREMIVLELRDAGWEVLEASTGEGALTQLGNHGYRMHALFTDIELGGLLSGWDVADACRSTYPRMRIVYASGRGVDPSRVLSDSRYFRKPYSCTAVIHACALP